MRTWQATGLTLLTGMLLAGLAYGIVAALVLSGAMRNDGWTAVFTLLLVALPLLLALMVPVTHAVHRRVAGARWGWGFSAGLVAVTVAAAGVSGLVAGTLGLGLLVPLAMLGGAATAHEALARRGHARQRA